MLPKFDSLPIRRPWRLLARGGGPWIGDPHANNLTLWTIQPRLMYDSLVEAGHVVADPAMIDSDFATAYAWMARMAEDRIPTTGPGLLWVWARVEKRALRECARHARNEVLLTLGVSADRALLSEFDEWHIVLNGGLHVARAPFESDDGWWARAEPLLDDFDARADAVRSPNDRTALQFERESSWEAIFDSNLWRPNQTIQGVVHAIHADDVIDAVRIR